MSRVNHNAGQAAAMERITPEIAKEFEIAPGWNYFLRVRTRWSDLDGYSHVSHRSHLVWFEDARNAYLAQFGFSLVDATVPGPVIRTLSCTYMRSLEFQDVIAVTARARWFGITSFAMEYAVWRRGLVASGTAVLVWLRNFDGTKVSLPDSLRSALIEDGAKPRSPSERI